MKMFCLFLCFSFSIFASNLHVVLAMDTQAENIGEGKAGDKRALEKWVHEVAAATGMTLKLSSLSGPGLQAETVATTIQKLSVGKEDALLFFFAGHGFLPQGKKAKWPNLTFNDGKHSIAMDGLIKHLRKKQPRLLVVGADCCS